MIVNTLLYFYNNYYIIKQKWATMDSTHRKNVSETLRFLDSVENQFTSFFSKFTDCFKVVKFSYRQHVFDYFQSLFKFEKKKANCQYMADHLSSYSQQSINRFVNSDLWSYRTLMDQEL